MLLIRSFTFGHALGVSLLGHAFVLGAIDLSALTCPYKIERPDLIQVGYIRGDNQGLGAGSIGSEAPAVEIPAPVVQDPPRISATAVEVKTPVEKAKKRPKREIDSVRAQLRSPSSEEVAPTVDSVAHSTDSAAGAINGEGQIASLNVGATTSLGGGGTGRGNGRGAYGPGDFPVRILSSPKPRYPEDARTFGFEGRVTLETKIGVDGRVKDIHVLKSSGRKDCDESALRVVRDRWRFRPASIGGEPMETVERISVRYTLVPD